MANGQLGVDLTGNPVTPPTGNTMILALILGAIQSAVAALTGGALGGGTGTYVPFHVANNGSTTIPVTAKRWAVNYVGTGTANTFGSNTAVTGGQGFSDNATPSVAIAIGCDGSTVADGFYSTT